MIPNAFTHRCVLSAALVVLASATVSAQSIVDANRVEFTPSIDEGVVDANGVPLVSGYAMHIFLAGDATVAEAVDLGKPQPDPDGYIRVDFMPLLSVPLTPGVSYEATVLAVGPYGSGESDRSNSFGLSLPCSFSLSPSTQSFSSDAGTGSFSVSTATTCQWTAPVRRAG